MRRLIFALVLVAILAGGLVAWRHLRPEPTARDEPAVVETAGGVMDRGASAEDVAPADPNGPAYPAVTPGRALAFPRDHGAHPDFRTEWWYLTGWLKGEDGRERGFQVTFFRTRPGVDQRNPSAFAARQILFAHAALSDPQVGKLLHAQRIARAGFGLAEAAQSDMDVVLDDWRLNRGADGRFHTVAGGEDFRLDLTFAPSQPPLLQGEAGYSRKGPRPEQASYYYSLPQMAVGGTVRRGARTVKVTGSAWMDREWSSTLLDPRAVGWDWAGVNMDDGGALMAFQVRGADGRPLWAAATMRAANGAVTKLPPSDVAFSADRSWRSPRTGAVYPVGQTITLRLPAGVRAFPLTPLFDDQELDSRASGGPVYWEGAVRTPGGRGYLELTGYSGALRL